MDAETLRRAANAGMFYPADQKALNQMIDTYLENARDAGVSGEIIGLISPHAGYEYSGQVAANAYQQIAGRNYQTVVVIAPSHTEYFPEISVYNGDGFKTPLGPVCLDKDLASQLVAQHRAVVFSARGHWIAGSVRQEHSLEVQLPFLQKVLKNFKIVPIVMGDQGYSSCQTLGETLAKVLPNKKALIVASSDLSHFHPYDRAVKLDKTVISHIERFDFTGLSEDIERGICEACGGGPMVAAMIAAEMLGANRAKVLLYANSGDVTGDRSSVVGYMAAMLYKEAAEKRQEKAGIKLGLSEGDKQQLLTLARTTVECELRGEEPPELTSESQVLNQKRGAFVTLTKWGTLRGCIGYVEAHKPLYQTVKEVAISAALHDPRFPPIGKEELKEIKVEISVLTPPRRIKEIEEIKVGRDGIIIKKGYDQGLLLPQVATEYGWDLPTFLEHTCHKAGLPKDAWQDKDTEIWIFSAEVFGEE
ncbi:MAG: AmmeMemoRadiSam system protein B [Candidatus Latescibacteria bacterium]|nr:AmmeMemoRadiSam system protein B [Candidatus Latescibacterota bacterium]